MDFIILPSGECSFVCADPFTRVVLSEPKHLQPAAGDASWHDGAHYRIFSPITQVPYRFDLDYFSTYTTIVGECVYA